MNKLVANAWTGAAAAEGPLAATKLQFATTRTPAGPDLAVLAPPKPADLAEWKDPRVGWGVILPAGQQAPAPIQRLLAARPGAPVFHAIKHENAYLLRADVDPPLKISIEGAERGIGKNQLPLYLLICGGPASVSWELQYYLNARCCVGRLDLTPEGLDRYVTALLGDWAGSRATLERPVVWSTDHDYMSKLMTATVADQVAARLAADQEYRPTRLAVADASREKLVDALAVARPALVVTTSHGQTAPLGNKDKMRADLGLPVDQSGSLLDAAKLVGAWEPDGAIWHAHACCSAGSDDGSAFLRLVEPNSFLHQTLDEVGRLGAMSAPLPRTLLGAEKPLRAFIGHVEPTFDWTLQDQNTKQFLGGSLAKALYDEICAGQPVGLAFREFFGRIGVLAQIYEKARDDYNAGDVLAEERMIRAQLVLRDVRSWVILGDPTVALG